jgi:hypothetical protein
MLKALVHEDFIPKRLGGKDNYVFDAKQYYQVSQYRSEIIKTRPESNIMKQCHTMDLRLTISLTSK